MFAKQLGNTLQQFREKRGLTIEQLAPLLSLEQNDVENLERGEFHQIGSLAKLKPCLRTYLEFIDLSPTKVTEVFSRLDEFSYYSESNEIVNPNSKKQENTKRLRMVFFIVALIAIVGLGSSYLFRITEETFAESCMTEAEFKLLYQDQLKPQSENEELLELESVPLNKSDLVLETKQSNLAMFTVSVTEPYRITIRNPRNEEIVNELLMPNEIHYLEAESPMDMKISPAIQLAE